MIDTNETVSGAAPMGCGGVRAACGAVASDRGSLRRAGLSFLLLLVFLAPVEAVSEAAGLDTVIVVLLLGGHDQDLTIQSAGKVGFSAGGSGAAELSGLTWLGGTQWCAVSDNDHTLYFMTIRLAPATGYPTQVTVDSSLVLAAGSDLEGVAFEPARESVFVSDESGPAVREHLLIDGSLLQVVAVPPVYANIRPNFSLESLALRTGFGTTWTANEEALDGDGSISTVGQGTVVRVQRFDAGQQPDGQWAYVTDGITAWSPFIEEERSGVSDMLALSDGQILVLERELGGVGILNLPEFRSRIYEVDLSAATDVSSIPALEGAVYTAAAKDLLWERQFSFANFEGLALGPQLDDGAYSLLLISDDGGGLEQALYALRLYGVSPRLDQDPLIRGQAATLTATGLEPGDDVFFLYSLSGTGIGPRVPQLGGLRLDLLPAVEKLGSAEADAAGEAELTVNIPSGAPLVAVGTQAVVPRGVGGNASVKTNALLDQIQP